MRILYYDCFSGISGDMNLAAMVDLGVEPSYLINELKKLNLDEYDIQFTIDQRKGISGTKAKVVLKNDVGYYCPEPKEKSSFFDFWGLFSHKHGHSHGHGHKHPHQHKHPHPHIHSEARNFSVIKSIINNSQLSGHVKNMSIEMFRKVAEAEAKIHGKSIDEVHFHEVGATDSIVDIVGAAICVDYLKPDKILASSVQLGGGMVKCAHGVFPVPAPATLEILKNIPVKLGAVNVETTTPTGAAILAVLVDEFTETPHLDIEKIAYGIGHRDNPIPNVLRVCLGKTSPASESHSGNTQPSTDEANAWVLECNIDDMNPEMYDFVMERLFEAGADDVFLEPILMKKNRPAMKISVLANAGTCNKLGEILLNQTSTLGYRQYAVEKKILERTWSHVETRWGSIRIKHGIFDGEIIKSKPEYDDCSNIARSHNIPISDVYKEVDSLLSLKKK
jgi:pyridinium-3,5-bisthiocarboxylic acid mononucleotide nickel chelatase